MQVMLDCSRYNSRPAASMLHAADIKKQEETHQMRLHIWKLLQPLDPTKVTPRRAMLRECIPEAHTDLSNSHANLGGGQYMRSLFLAMSLPDALDFADGSRKCCNFALSSAIELEVWQHLQHNFQNPSAFDQRGCNDSISSGLTAIVCLKVETSQFKIKIGRCCGGQMTKVNQGFLTNKPVVF